MGAPQELIAGRYRLTRRIAAGGMGVVWEARDELLERPVAVKQLRALAGLPEEEAAFAKQRAMREARITARLHHPNAVVVFDSVEHDGEPCLVMQYVPSEPLSAVLRRRGALPVDEVARIGAQIAAALAAAHDLGIVHRDVKPGNILIADADGAALLSDFGISHALGDATLTSTGLMHGTPAYLSPEVARGEESTFAADVFSLGSTLYAASEGAAPFGEAPNSIAVLHRVAVGGFAAPRRSGALGPLLLQMMADDPAARPTMADVARQLQALRGEEDAGGTDPLPLAGAAESETAAIPVLGAGETLVVPPDVTTATEPDRQEPPAPPVSGRPQTSRRRVLLAVAATLLVLLIGGIGLTRLLQPDAPASGGTTADEPAPAPATASTRAVTPSPEPSTATPTPRSTPGPTPKPAPTTRPTTAPSPAPRPTGTASAPAGSVVPSTGATAAISSYYGLVPGNTDAAWNRLTAGYQTNHAGGRAAFDRFWRPVRSVSASGVRSTGSGVVRATVTYRYSDGRVVVEDTSFALVPEGGVLKIAGSTVISSRG